MPSGDDVSSPRQTTGRLPELELAEGTLVVADLHLGLAQFEASREFVRWLDGLGGTPRLIVLGDLFETWIGPAQERSAGAPPVLDALARRTRAGTAIELVPGNRDFLLDASFEERTGVRLHPEGLVGLLPGGVRLLFLHGDELCTLDRSYQRLKRVIRSRAVRWVAPRIPRRIAFTIARGLRSRSGRAVASKPSAAMACQPEEVRRLVDLHGVSGIVCGHAHDFRDERIDGGARWVVLDAFGGERDLVRVGRGGGLEFERSSSAAV